MTDMLVRLYDLPELRDYLGGLQKLNIKIRRPNAWEKILVTDWIGRHFTLGWSAECEVAFSARPPSCFIAIEADSLIGFACHDCTRLNFFGPTGVTESARNRGIGRVLLLSCLHAMRNSGYAYAIIGGVGPVAFYSKAVGATVIDGSSPGIYDLGLIQKKHSCQEASDLTDF